ncbi:MAG: bifunctional folylpolyglutamate synthase/dihydrofolate synthase, partial [Chloroflexi bacterium]|nr:bifunctional folylpolyglutamate synthase/dihydrofolate synthase [Chloroflexota bacterium]
MVDHERGDQNFGSVPGVGTGDSLEQKQGPRQKSIFNLERIEALLSQLGNPHKSAPVVHVAGTKGKGSTAAFCDSVLHAAGYRTGFYSSPHLHSFRERVRINTQPISEHQFAALVELVWPRHLQVTANSGLGPVTLFEFMTAMGFLCFAGASAVPGELDSVNADFGPVDFQVIEVGLGGRLDATNVVAPAVCVITSISLDHTAILGDSLDQIAFEKAGIIKPGSTVVIAPQKPEAASAIAEVCQRMGARSIHVGQDVTWELTVANAQGQEFAVHGRLGDYKLRTPLLGTHQLANAATAVATLEVLQEQGHNITTDALAQGFASVSWPCRMEVLAHSPLVVTDGAHNLNSMETLLDSLPRYLDYRRLILIAGFSRDKSVEDMVRCLEKAKPMVFATASRHPRSLSLPDVAERFAQQGISVVKTATTAEALSMALDAAGDDDLVLATGSLFVAAEVREAVLGIEPEI